uniref:Uncharacterized protein n=1 Tax=Glossina palpalis gambiensis TaxID=67801 RepID=A0A1B0B7A0_9MUSC
MASFISGQYVFRLVTQSDAVTTCDAYVIFTTVGITQRVFAICVTRIFTIAAIRYKQTVLGFKSANNELAVRRLLTYTTANRKPIPIVVNVAVRIARDGVIYHVNRVSNVAQVCLKMLILIRHCAKPVSGSLIRISIIIKVTSKASNEKTRCSSDCDFFTIGNDPI